MLKLSNICKSIAAVFVAASASLAVEVWDGSVAESFAEGKGTVAEPYKISNGAELALFAQRVSIKGDTTLNAVLTNDIYLNENSEEYEKWGENAPANKWSVPIGLYNHKFQGSFDGKGHKVYGAYLDANAVSKNYTGFGFFGTTGATAVVRNLGVEQSYVSMTASLADVNVHAAIFVGVAEGATRFYNVSASGLVKVDVKNVSGKTQTSENGCFAGYFNKGVVLNAAANCTIISSVDPTSTAVVSHIVGGFIGKTVSSFVENVYSRSSVSNPRKAANTVAYMGGIVGDFSTATDTLYNAFYNVSTVGSENAPTASIGNSKGLTKNVSSKTSAKMKSEEFAALLGPAFTYTATKNDGYPFPVVFEGAAAFDGGDGSEASPYLIGSAKSLRAVSGLVNGMNAEFGGKSYKMTADVELNEDSETYKSWETTPPAFSWFQIGREYHRKDTISVDCGPYDVSACSKNYFRGVFDGNHHSVKGLYVSDTTNLSQGGLFMVASNATIKNIGVEQSFISVKGRAAGILGIGLFVSIDSCHNASELRSFSQDNGGIVGVISNSTISNSYNIGNLKTVSNKRTAWSNGGIAGEIFRQSIVENSWNSGNVVAVNVHAGGVVGVIDSSHVINVYNMGNVSSDSATGGVVGTVRYSSTLKNAYNIGSVSSKVAARRGGVVGQMIERASPKNEVRDSYYNSQTIGSTNAPTAAIGTMTGTVTNVSALPTASMTTGRFAIMLGESYKQDDALNDGYPVFLEEGETYGAEHLFAGGKGTADDPYQIATATQLRNMEYLVNKKNAGYGDKHYKLVADISLNDNSADYLTWEKTVPANVWTPMGVDTTVSFKGVFDGGNYTISGLYTNAKFSGLFGVVDTVGVIKNVIVKKSFVKTVAGRGMAGAVVGYNKGSISISKNEGAVFGNNSEVNSTIYCGGIVGYNLGGAISDVSNMGPVTAMMSSKSNTPMAGGVVGYSYNGIVKSAKNTGYIKIKSSANSAGIGNSAVGGIVGNMYHSLISHCVNEGSVYIHSQDSSTAATINPKIGGIAGHDDENSIIEWCDNYGKLTGFASSLASSSQSSVRVGGILGNSYRVKSTVRNSRNFGDIDATSKYAYSASYVGGIVANSVTEVLIENCYASGMYTVATSATSTPNKIFVYVGGLMGFTTGSNSIKGSFFYGSIKTTNSATTKTVHVGGLVGNNAGSITGSYFDSEVAGITAVTGNNTGTLTKSKALTTAEMQTNEFAWLLNTLGGDSTNSNVFSRYNSYPEFATDDQLPIYRVVFDDEVDIKNLYTSYKGYISAPTNPEPAPGEMFVGWTDGDKYMLQNRQVINKDMTLYALFTLVTEPIYTITFVDGKDVLVKATENDGKIANFPVAKNIPMGYHFDGWYDNATNKAVEEDMAFTGTATLIAKFSANLYKITFLDYDGSEISSEDVAYGTTPKAPKATRESTEDFSYTLKGWTPDIDVVVGDASYTAVYDSTKIESSSSEEQVSSSSTEESSASVEKTSSSSTEVSSDSDNKSSSSEKASSSSVKPSSSSAKSSSSTKNSSSSAVKSSASSAKSSSSTSDKKSSSSKGGDKDAIYTIAQAPQFNVSVAGRTLQIAGAQSGAKISVFDLRGNVMYAGFVYASNINVEMPRSGSYLVRIGNQTQRVNVK